MKRAIIQLVMLLFLGTAPATLAQVRNIVRVPPPNFNSTRGPRFSPLRNGLGLPSHATTPVRSTITQPTTGQCANGDCSSEPGRGQVISAHTSSELVQGGAVSTASGPGAPVGAINGSSAQSLTPMPQQPLGNVLIRQKDSVRITIRAISAERAGTALEIDGRLGPIDHDLRSFADQFSYRSYRLLDVQTFDLDFRSIAQMELPGSRAIEVEPRLLATDGRVKVHLELFGQHRDHAPGMRTDYSIPRGRTILVGGYRIDPELPERGTLLIAITQDE